MRQYIARRLLQMIPIVIGVSFIIFMVFALAPGDFVDSKTNPNVSVQKLQELRKIYGLDKPPVQRYFNWAKYAIQGNFGDSLKYKQPVTAVINTYVWNSFYLSVASFLFAVILAIPIGVVSATKQYSIFDMIFTVFALVGISIPAFFFSYLLMKIFALDHTWFPVGGKTTAGSNYTGVKYLLDVMKHMFLPFLVLSLTSVGSLMRYTRTSMLEVIRQDYIRTARAKGLSEKIVIYKHALRNGLIPVITILGLYLPALFSGAIITERIFLWPGIGRISLDAISARDYPLLMGFNMLIAILTLVGNLLADVSYALVDPRIRLK